MSVSQNALAPAGAPPSSAAPYTPAFFDGQRDVSLRSAERVVPYVLSLVAPRSVVDVGCGTGTWLSVFRRHGVEDVLGLDGGYVDRARLLVPAERFAPADLAGDWGVGRRFDLAVSLEVAEHLPPGTDGAFVARLCRLAPTVLFSAALPHQGGTHHVNERWPSHWAGLFAREGFAAVDVLRGRFWDDPEVDLCYRNNALLFADPAAHPPGSSPLGDLLSRAADAPPTPRDVVHPERWEMAVRGGRPEALSLFMLLRLLPGAAARALRNRLLPAARAGSSGRRARA